MKVYVTVQEVFASEDAIYYFTKKNDLKGFRTKLYLRFESESYEDFDKRVEFDKKLLHQVNWICVYSNSDVDYHLSVYEYKK